MECKKEGRESKKWNGENGKERRTKRYGNTKKREKFEWKREREKKNEGNCKIEQKRDTKRKDIEQRRKLEQNLNDK